MLRKTLEQMKDELEFGGLVVNKYFELLGIEDFYIEEDEDIIAGLHFLIEKEVRENGIANLMRRHKKVHDTLNRFLNNHKFLISRNAALIYANRVDQLWLALRKYINMYADEYRTQLLQDEEKQFVKELNNVTLPE